MIVCGRHTLTIPAGALKTDQEVTLVDVTDAQGAPALSILPDGIRFKGKATLVTEVSDMLDPAGSAVYWLHPIPHNRVTWSLIGGTMAPGGTAVLTTLGRTGVFVVGPAS